MKKIGKKKEKEFLEPYTVTGAVTKGNIITKISLLIMGFGNIAHKQIGKGIMFLLDKVRNLQLVHASIPWLVRAGKSME